jgi:outer membrane lipoprotein-sorting protein
LVASNIRHNLFLRTDTLARQGDDMIREWRSCLGAGLMVLAVSPAFAEGGPLQLPSATPAAAPAAIAIAKSAVPAKVATVDAATAIKKANVYFNNTSTMVADFTQIGADGRQSQGRLYVQKPGRLRFEYDAPATLEIVADGRSVAVRDRKLATQDVYFIWQTPLKFLLDSQVDLARDTKILDVSSDPDSTSIMVEDSATLGGTSRIRLVFDSATFTLKQWSVVDPQGYETLVSLANIDTAAKLDSSLFQITYQTGRDDNP